MGSTGKAQQPGPAAQDKRMQGLLLPSALPLACLTHGPSQPLTAPIPLLYIYHSTLPLTGAFLKPLHLRSRPMPVSHLTASCT